MPKRTTQDRRKAEKQSDRAKQPDQTTGAESEEFTISVSEAKKSKICLHVWCALIRECV